MRRLIAVLVVHRAELARFRDYERAAARIMAKHGGAIEHAYELAGNGETLREFFTMIMMVDLDKANVSFDELRKRLNAKGDAMGLKIDAQHEDIFKFMHRV